MSELPKVMHVEDDADIREIALIALETIGGLVVEQCPSGQCALDRAPAFAPDLFLMDVMMPGMSGEETFLRLRELPQFVKTPVIFMTAKAQSNEVDKLVGMGAIEVITKPFDPMTLADQIVALWRGAGAAH